MTVMKILPGLFLLLLAVCDARAQFGAAFLQNEKYWNDGKAEFDIYEARLVREGAPRACEVIHILVREPFDPAQLVKPDDWQKPGMISVLKMNQIIHAPTGIYVWQQMHSSFWRAADGALVKWSLTSNDSCGNTFKIATDSAPAPAAGGRQPGGEKARWTYDYNTYWDGMAKGEESFDLPPGGCFYDELPLRVRSIDFTAASAAKSKAPETGGAAPPGAKQPAASEPGLSAAPDAQTSESGLAANPNRPQTRSATRSAGGGGEFEIHLAPSVINSKKDRIVFAPAKVAWQRDEGKILVTVTHAGGTDTFTLAPEFPYLLREWRMADGSELKLKQSLKIDYWRYSKPGDKERALADPALQNR